MPTLADQLRTIHEAGQKRIPPEKFAVMSRTTEDLRNSGILDSVIKVGDPLPALSLRNSRNELVETGSLLAHGPVVLTVFRGSW
ncbi:MAG: hypothetical protein ACI9W2_003130 [Gammaproteobacteria bacterium]|jgi:hypothetical protein